MAHSEEKKNLPFGRLGEPSGQTHYRHQRRGRSSPQSSALGKERQGEGAIQTCSQSEILEAISSETG